MGGGRGRRDNELIGQTVRISQGPYKGELPGWGGLGAVRGGEPTCLTACLPLPRIYWCGEGCHRVHGPCGAAFYLPDHLCGPPAAHHSVCLLAREDQKGVLSSERAPPTPLIFYVHRGSWRPGGMTSTYGRTPMYGSQTPMYGSGSRTPMYGSQTPLQDGEHSQRTQGQGKQGGGRIR
jgi:transcription elongation factor SPT5